MKNKIIRILNDINFADKYISICNNFSDYNNGKKFTKQEVKNIIDENGMEMRFMTKEGLFLKDYVFENFNVRFLLGYKYGFIDCMYWISKEQETILNESFRGVALIQDDEFNEKVFYRFPIATTILDLKEILNRILELNNRFILELKKVCM